MEFQFVIEDVNSHAGVMPSQTASIDSTASLKCPLLYLSPSFLRAASKRIDSRMRFSRVSGRFAV
jgi:hypothetical protein